MSNPQEPLAGITEDDIAHYLASNPSFFERYAGLLASVQLTHPQGHRTVSLQERQAQMLRDRIKGLEKRVIEMIRNGQENIGHFEKLQRWTLEQMQSADPEQLHLRLRDLFLIPATALRLFEPTPEAQAAGADWAQPVSDEVRRHAQSLSEPYCGVNEGFEAAGWVRGQIALAASLALVPLRHSDGAVFGLLVLASPDATRYSADKGLEFLLRVSEVASVALSRFATTPLAAGASTVE